MTVIGKKVSKWNETAEPEFLAKISGRVRIWFSSIVRIRKSPDGVKRSLRFPDETTSASLIEAVGKRVWAR